MVLKRKLRNINLEKDFSIVAENYHEESPRYYCRNCRRFTKFGREPLRVGITTYGIIGGICTYCKTPLTKMDNSDKM